MDVESILEGNWGPMGEGGQKLMFDYLGIFVFSGIHRQPIEVLKILLVKCSFNVFPQGAVFRSL